MLFKKIFLVLVLISYDSIFSGFPADTLIKTQSTYTKIQDLKVGDHVACFDLVNKKIKFQPICCLKSHIEKNWVCITLDNKKIVAADNQKFYLPVEKRWKKAKKLKTGTVLLKHSADQVQIQEVSKLAMEIELFDISVVDEHNYFVSNNDILVHNFPPVVIGVTLAFGGGAIEFAGISAGIVTVAGVIGLKLRKKQQKSSTIQAQELSQNIGTSTQYYLQHGTYEVVINQESPSQESYSYKSKPRSSKKPSNQTPSTNCASPSPEDPEEFKKKHPHGKYVDASYHHKNSSGLKSPAPKNGQAALDNSLPIKDSKARIAISEGEFVVLKPTCEGIYHGYVDNWASPTLTPHMRNALIKAGLVSRRGKIL